MLERDGYIPGVPCWIDTGQPDPEAAVAFYGGLFGWEFEDVMPPESPARYFVGRLRGGDVAAISSPAGDDDGGGGGGAVWNTYIWVDNADETAAKVRQAGGRVVTEPFDVGEAGRMAVCADPEGAAFCLWQARRHKGARIVNEPGSLNFNGLSVRDADRARAFYGAVFGWEPMEMGGGAVAWRLPGYGAHLEERDPGLRQRMADSGAPEGFADVVATLNPLDAGGPAHWSVTFAVGDADAAAVRAAELGGRVLSGPFDAPWVRVAVLSDPQGATFIASQFVPENRDVYEPADAGAGAAA